jgi:hypothetical protein
MYALPKRNKISPARANDLRKENPLYRIECVFPDCACHLPGGCCERGFFSLFLEALYGIAFARRYRLPYYVDFARKKYYYTDQQAFPDEPNFWNYYFQQPLTASQTAASDNPVGNLYHETFPLRIWQRTHLQTLHQVFKENITFQPAVLQMLNQKTTGFNNLKVLGVHLRMTDHHVEIEPVRLEKYLQVLKKKESHFDKIFIATDDARVLKEVTSHFNPKKIIFHNLTRSEDGNAVHTRREETHRYQLGLEALLDGYSLARCREIIIPFSNLSYAALVMNPELIYTLMETRLTRLSRLKTTFLYQLDRWKIRTL